MLNLITHRWTTFLETTREQQVTWLGTGATTRNKFTTELPQSSLLRRTHHSLHAGGAMPLGSAGRQVTRIYLPVLSLVDLMPMITLPMNVTTTSKQSLLPTTMLLFLAYWPGLVEVVVAITNSCQVPTSC